MAPKKSVIRQLRAGEAIPVGEPRRYRSGQGYVRLRWKIGVRTYVEVYEHRVVDGRVTEAEHVHHSNHRRDDNRAENLRPLSAREHWLEHGSPFGDEVVRRYTSGEPTTTIAEDLGLNTSHVYRLLKAREVDLRAPSSYCRPLDYDQLKQWHSEGVRAAEMIRRLKVSRKRLYRAFEELDLPRFPSGRPWPPTSDSTRPESSASSWDGGDAA